MSHCHDEHEDHHHGHDHDHTHVHDHTDDITPAIQNHIYQQIDFDAINTLNEKEPRSGAAICKKTWAERLEEATILCSDADEQLLMHIPFVKRYSFIKLCNILTSLYRFTAQIRLHSILIRTSQSSTAPRTLKVFVNREDIDFSTASDLQPTQSLSLSQISDIQDIPVKRALFNAVRSIDLFFEDNWSDGDSDETQISYIGFKGEWMPLNREPISFLYEAAANPADHKLVTGVKGEVGSRLGGAGGRDG